MKGTLVSNAADLWKLVERYRSYLITSHVRPDVDAIGSELALALFFERLGKNCRIVNESPLPRPFAFLPHSEKVLVYPEGMDYAYEVLVCLDAPEVSRTGRVGQKAREVPTVIVDHHPYTSCIADVAWVDHTISSTGEMLLQFMRYRSELIDADIATCLYAAVLTDTGRFTYGNTSRRTLEAAAELVGLGARAQYVAENCYENLEDGQVYLIGVAASRMRRAAGGKVAYTSLSAEDFQRAGVGPEGAQELAELPRSLEGVKVGVLLRDVGGKIKVSLRSKGGTDVKAIAERYGGGGHHEASGFLLELPLEEAEIEVIRALEEYIQQRHI